MHLLPLMTALILFFSGIVIGYLFSFRDRSDEEALNESLTLERDRLASELDSQRSESQSLGENLNKQKGKLQLLEELCNDLDKSKKSSDKRLIELQSELSSNRNLLDESRKKLNEENRRRTQAEDRVHAMRQGHVESLNTVQNNWREKISKKTIRIDQQEKEIERLKAAIGRSSEKAEQAESQLAELKSDLENQKSLLLTANNNVNGLEKEYISLESSIKNQNELLNEARGKAAAAVSARELAEESLRDMREQLDAQQKKLIQLDALAQDAEAAKHRCEALDESLSNNNERLINITAERDAAISAEQQAITVISGLRKRTENQESTIRSLRESNEQISTKYQLEASARTELEESHQQDRRQLEIRLAAYSGIESRVDELKAELASKSVKLEEIESELRDELEQQKSTLTSQMTAAMDEQSGQFKLRLEQLVSQRDQAMTECNELRDEVGRLTALAQQNEETIRNLRRERGAILLRNRQAAAQTQENFPRLMQGEISNSQNAYAGSTRVDPVRGVVFTETPDTRDDLKLISGIAEVLERRLNDYGIFTYKQIMDWDQKAVDEFSSLLTFKERIERDDWKGQAAILHGKKHIRRAA